MERTSALGRELKKLKRNYDLFLLFLPVVAFYVIFKYIPMYGVLLAFKDYKMKLGILSSPWAPSLPIPVISTPMASSPAVLATDSKRTSTEGQ